MAEILRTPDERFVELPDFPFEPKYLETLTGYEGLRMHYIDEGLSSAENTFLCLHGEPTWSYLYRKMLPVFTDTGGRVVAPDLFGFGRSDKPADDAVYTFEFHRNALIALIRTLGLKNITLVCQDWGGILGLTLPMDMAGCFTRLLVMNTTLGTGDDKLSEGFLAWRNWVGKNPDMAVGKLMQRSCPHLTDGELAAYDAPFPNVSYKAGVRRFPELVPDSPDAPGARLSRRAREWWRNEWTGQAFMAVGTQDPVLGPAVMKALHKNIKNCFESYELAEAGHFAQEWGEDIAKKALLTFVRDAGRP